MVIVALMFGCFAQADTEILEALNVSYDKASIALDDITVAALPQAGIPALGFGGDWTGATEASSAPKFVQQTKAARWLGDEEPVIVVTMREESRAYPIQILLWHEIINDALAGVPIAVTFCPLCNSAMAFDRRIPLTEETEAEVLAHNPDAKVTTVDEAFAEAYSVQYKDDVVAASLEVTFGVSGMLHNANLLMFDSESSTLWSQFIGKGTVGTLSETQLLRYPAQVVNFAEFRDAFPDALVLSRETGYGRGYGSSLYADYDGPHSRPRFFKGELDERLPLKMRVATLELAGESVAYPFDALMQQKVIHDDVGDQSIVLFWQEGLKSVLDTADLSQARDIGGVGVFNRFVDGQKLDFQWQVGRFVDAQTGSSWNLLGQAEAGPLAGKTLTPILHDTTLWFAWAAFKPDTRVYGQALAEAR